jgi:hypothetical protein
MLNLRRSQTRMGANVEEEPKHPLEVVTGYQAHYVNGVILAALYALAVPRKRLGLKSGVVYSLVFPEAAMMLVMLPAMWMGPAGSKGMGVGSGAGSDDGEGGQANPPSLAPVTL